MHDTLQILVAVLGILSQLLLLGKQFYGGEQSREVPAATLQPQVGQQIPGDRHGAPTKLDLSFVLIASAFFSLLLTDSLLISGRNPSAGFRTIISVSFITLVIVTTMYAAWRMNRAELVTGCLAITTLIVLIISSGGPFFPEAGAVAGLSLVVPIFSLITLTAAMFIYAFGNPLTRTIEKKRRILVSTVLVTLVLISATALGQQLVIDVTNDPRTPAIKSVEAQTLAHRIMSESLSERRRFYQLASEVALAQVYHKYFRATATKQGNTLQTIREESADVTPPPSPQPSQSNPRTSASPRRPNAPQNSDNNRAIPNSTPASPPAPRPNPPADRNREELKRMMYDAYNRGELERARALERLYLDIGSGSDLQVLKGEGVQRTKLLLDFFATLGFTHQQRYVLERLNWINPAGLDGQSEATIPMQGNTAEQRFENLANYRIFAALKHQANLREKLLKEFDGYSPDITDYFNDLDRRTRMRTRILDLTLQPESDYDKPSLFPKMGTDITSAQLQTQLALPIPEEAYAAYRDYQLLALVFIKQDLKDKQIEEQKIDELAATFNRMDDVTQDAFLAYVINNKKVPPDKVYQMLWDLKGVDFSALTNPGNQLAVEKLSLIFGGQRVGEPALLELANNIHNSESREAKDTFLALLKNQEPEPDLRKMFQPQVFELTNLIHGTLGADRAEFFECVADPVWTVIRKSSRPPSAKTDKAPIEDELDSFRRLDASDQGGILQQLSITLYQPGGPYALDPIRLLVSQAKSLNDKAALVCAGLISLPPLLICILIGGFFSRKLVSRDRLRDLVRQEKSGPPAATTTLGTPVELFGRDETLRSLRNLAERGWSTIGVVGRRGVGKSRLLYALFQSKFAEVMTPTIKVWVSSPSKFHEEDFIYSIFERLALSTEGTIANYLGAKPISIRRIESRGAQVGAWLYIAAMIVLGFVVYQMNNRLTRSDIIITWLPILAIVFTSIWLFVDYLTKLQPVNLSSWLQRDRSHNPHTVMLYKEVFDILKVLRERTRDSSTRLFTARLILRATGLIVLCGVLVIASFFIMLNYARTFSSLIFGALILAMMSAWAVFYLFQRRGVPDERFSAHGQSLMSLVADYRAFATSIVHRLSQGALGHSQERKFSVLICVDELDKIVDFEEIRAFVRRIKAIFEVPGVYYYVSLAEDTLTSLYLGPAAGKNEIDSAFDHIIRIPNLPCHIGEKIASEYLKTHGVVEQPSRLARTIATLSFGIPRDVIRRCDEYIARDGRSSIEPKQLARELRRMQADMGYELRQLTRAQVRELTQDDAIESANAAKRIFAEGLDMESAQRLMFSVWLIALIEAASDIKDESHWDSITEDISTLGYRLPIDSVVDLHTEIKNLEPRALDNATTASQVA